MKLGRPSLCKATLRSKGKVALCLVIWSKLRQDYAEGRTAAACLLLFSGHVGLEPKTSLNNKALKREQRVVWTCCVSHLRFSFSWASMMHAVVGVAGA